MRKEARRSPEIKKWWEDKRIILSGSIGCMILVLIIGVALFSSNSRHNENYNSIARQNQIISLNPENEIKEDTESASSSVGKSLEEVQSDENKNNTNVVNNTTANTTTNSTNTLSNNKNSNTSKVKETKNESKQVNVNAKEEKETSFTWPIKGDILKAFSVDNLLYSSTLKEWTVHNGIDIKAEKAAIVCAAADGKIKSIKNDPRYGITVIIEHSSGYKTVYSNLLTSEFVVEGEQIKQGQTIGTVGNSANFEVADESHLHFEVLKDNKYVDPMQYLK